MNNTLSSVLLLLLAIALLWAAVTNRLGRWLDGLDVALGTKTAGDITPTSATPGGVSGAATVASQPFFSLPGLNPNARAGGVTPAALGASAMTTAFNS